MDSHIGRLRREVAQKKIKAKIRVLEGYAKKGVPEGAFVPKNLAEFRRWEDSSLGVEQIGSPNTLDRPYNKEQKKRAQERAMNAVAELEFFGAHSGVEFSAKFRGEFCAADRWVSSHLPIRPVLIRR